MVVWFEAAIPTAFEAIEGIDGVPTSTTVIISSSVSVTGLCDMTKPPAKKKEAN